jgi:predicted component of type VI protein secretion system
MVIQVLLRDPRSGSETKYEFDQSPVRIGRNQLNNVVLDGNFVSGWHGTIRFDNTGTYYFDLGSTNGTCIDGKRLPKNTAIPLQQTTRLTIWMYELVVTPGVPGGLAEAPARKTNAGTLVGAGGGTESLESAARAPVVSGVHGMATRGAGPFAPAPTPPPPTAAPGRPISRAGAPGLPDEQTANRLVRCLRIIGAFTDAFIGLKKGYEQFGSEVGVRPLSGNTPLHRARTSQEIIEYLLDPAKDPDACARDLNAVFADMGIHDVALMEGISQSVRGILEKLDPNVLNLKMGAGLWSGSKAKSQWNAYVEAFNNLLGEDSALHAEIFGEEFARAYASVALGDETASQRAGDTDAEDGN